MFGRRNKKIGIAFGGGGARGIAHIGVIKAMREHGVEFDFVAGTSAGSVAAALYSVAMPYNDIYDAVKNLKERDFLTSRVFLIPSNPANVAQTMQKVLGDMDSFEKCKTPLAILSVDLFSGKEFVFRNGMISHAISASCAVPGLFSPVMHEDMCLMDGGLSNNIPAQVLRDMGCDAVVSVEVNELGAPVARGTGIVDIISASIKILVSSNSAKGVMASDIVIRPDMKKYKFNKIASVDEMIEEGYRAALTQMPEILKLFR